VLGASHVPLCAAFLRAASRAGVSRRRCLTGPVSHGAGV